jgi:uncharacterized membrane protein YkvA (DUF1232 family)
MSRSAISSVLHLFAAPAAAGMTTPADWIWWEWLVFAGAVALVVYVGFVVWLIVLGRRDDARALAGFVPDCVVLFHRLLGDGRMPRWSKLLLLAPIAYLASPIDLVPDFIPVAGQLDDAIVAALFLRAILRSGGPELVREHWPGPTVSLELLLRLA